MDLKKIFETKIPENPVIKSEMLKEKFIQLLDCVISVNEKDTIYREIASKGYLLSFLGEVLPFFRFKDTPIYEDSVKRILKYCIENFTKKITLDQMAGDLYLNKYYISHVFKDRFHTSITIFINNLRVGYACELLKRVNGITEVAFQSGFSSIRTFNRVFSKCIGMTPGEFAKKQK